MDTEAGETEAGTPTVWPTAWREGHAHGLARGLGIPYREAWQRTIRMLAGEPLDLGRAASFGATTRNRPGDWVPAIPLPFIGMRQRCSCGQKFWTRAGYRGHYALAHILDLPDGG